MLVFILLLVTLFPTCHSANVLVIAGMRGSHLYVSLDTADKLVEFGHNVTVLTACSDKRVDLKDRAFHFVTILDADEDENYQFVKDWDTIMLHFMHHPSVDMMLEFLVSQASIEEVKRWMDDYNSVMLKYFNGESFPSLLDSNKFDLIVLEDTVSLPAMIHLHSRDIPIIGLYCTSIVKDVNARFGLPGLINSEPATVNDVKSSAPTFTERWQTTVRSVRAIAAIIPIIKSVFRNVPTDIWKISDYFIAPYDVVFINDHPAFSFPFISPANMFYLGPFNLEDRPLAPLPEDYSEFLAQCPYKKTALFSFGSYLLDITTFLGTPIIINPLRHMEVCVIIRSNVDLISKFDLNTEQFLVRSWIPQKDLLGSGNLDYFISHCGNNGRMEAIYYNVPLLCIPLFADQYYNARLVERNKFGLLLTWETLTEETLTKTVDELLTEQGNVVANMKRAVEIARADPGAGTDVLKFYTDLLIKNRNADYLINRIILNQSTNELYNLDIAAVLLIFFMCFTAGVLFCVVKCFRRCCHKLVKKVKDD